MKYFLLFLFLSSCILHISSQVKFDNKLVFGSSQGAILNFENGEPIVENFPQNFGMNGANASICDENGELLFYTNGCQIFNKNFEIMVNGDSISNLGSLHNLFCGSTGSPLNQSALILPRPSVISQYYVIHNDLKSGPNLGRIYYSVVDVSLQDGEGEVILKNQVLYEGEISRTGMATTKHANGIGWWIIFPILESNEYLKLLVNEQGVEVIGSQKIGHVWTEVDLQGQHVFSPDGKTYARFIFENGLNIFDFDNQTGLLSNPLQIDFDFIKEAPFAGVAISPNSRFLYTNAIQTIHQFDLHSDDISSSRVLIGEFESQDSLTIQTRFYQSFLGPDGKIYIGGIFQYNHLHTIHHPDCKGLKSNFELYSIRLGEPPGFSLIGAPDIPHFRNQPQDIDCDTVTIISSSHSISLDKDIAVYPNPVNDKVFIANTSDNDIVHQIELISTHGQLMATYLYSKGDKAFEIPIYEFQSGMYYLLFYDDANRLVGRKKFIKID